MTHWTPEQIATLRRMHKEGWKYEDIAYHLRRSLDACKSRALKLGLRRRGYVKQAKKKAPESPFFNPRERECWITG